MAPHGRTCSSQGDLAYNKTYTCRRAGCSHPYKLATIYIIIFHASFIFTLSTEDMNIKLYFSYLKYITIIMTAHIVSFVARPHNYTVHLCTTAGLLSITIGGTSGVRAVVWVILRSRTT